MNGHRLISLDNSETYIMVKKQINSKCILNLCKLQCLIIALVNNMLSAESLVGQSLVLLLALTGAEFHGCTGPQHAEHRRIGSAPRSSPAVLLPEPLPATGVPVVGALSNC